MIEVYNGTKEECEEYKFAHGLESAEIIDDFISDTEELYCYVMVQL